jgi:hypothetical protein
MSGFAEPEHTTPDVVHASLWGGVPRRVWQWPPLARVHQYVPRSIESMLRGVTARDLYRRQVDTTRVADFLRPIQRRQTEELMRLVGRDFPEWTTLNNQGGSPPRTHESAVHCGIGDSA